MNIPLLVEYFLVLLGYDFNKKSRLDPVEPETRFQKWCNKIAPYIIFFGIIFLAATLIIILIKYGGGVTGSEANRYEHLTQIID